MAKRFAAAFGQQGWSKLVPAVAFGVVVSGTATAVCRNGMDESLTNMRHFLIKPVLAEGAASAEMKTAAAIKMTADSREQLHHKRTIRRRFETFASLSYKGDPVMTPTDFLESVTQSDPRPRIGRRMLDTEAVSRLVSKTPDQSKSTPDFFRKCDVNGIISFSEYCFLISCITKSKSTFRIAFNMFDRDGNEKIDKAELEVLTGVISGTQEASSQVPISTVTSHFFGSKGNKVLAFKEFSKFLDNLQTEILEIEFNEYSKGLQSISELEFARILLRHTMISEEEQEKMLENLVTHGSGFFQGVSFKDFKSFFQFLNNIDDFTVAISMYGFAGQPLGKEAFHRAYKITTGGLEISPNILDTLYVLFDADNDGKLSKREFIGVMKDTVQRGFRYNENQFRGSQGFKDCLKHEMKLSSRKL
jgi:Ca2+-binding EF-hand superfamily protein